MAKTPDEDTETERDEEAAAPPEAGRSEAEGAASDAPSTSDAVPKPRKKKRKKKAKRTDGPEPVAPAERVPAAASSGRTVLMVAVGVVALTVAGVVYMNRRGGADRWRVGETVSVDITLIAADAKNLACAASDEVAGRHCAFEPGGKPWSKGPPGDDKTTLRPYTTSDKKALLAAGLWSDPALSGTLPTARFEVRCRFQVEGMVKKPGIRWMATAPFSDTPGDWYAGTLSGCQVVADGGSPAVAAPGAGRDAAGAK